MLIKGFKSNITNLVYEDCTPLLRVEYDFEAMIVSYSDGVELYKTGDSKPTLTNPTVKEMVNKLKEMKADHAKDK